MRRYLFTAFVAALVLAGGAHVSNAAPPALFFVCELQDRSRLFIVVNNFDGMFGALRQCVDFWHGRPQGVTNDPGR